MEPQTNPTHPNAYRAEANTERTLAAQHAGRANELDVKAGELEKELGIVHEDPAEPEEVEDTSEEKKPGVFSKK